MRLAALRAESVNWLATGLVYTISPGVAIAYRNRRAPASFAKSSRDGGIQLSHPEAGVLAVA
jgi:hypothetical protein